MTTIQIATSIPSQITKLEEIAWWAASSLAHINPSLVAIEGAGYTERVAQAGIFYVPADNKFRALARLSFEVSPDHLAGGLKQWKYIQEFGNTELPQLFRSN